MIIDASGQLVWFHPLGGVDQPFDFRAQTFAGKPVLTWWQGSLLDTHGSGVGQIYNTAYRPVASVKVGNGYEADLHQFKLTSQGTALIAAYAVVPWDVSSLGGGKDDPVSDQVVQEVDVKTGAALFEWHSLGDVALSESYEPLPKDPKAVYDPVHVNSIDEEPNGTCSSPPGIRTRSLGSPAARPGSAGGSAASAPPSTAAASTCSHGSTTPGA
jgi:hypothetical protein